MTTLAEDLVILAVGLKPKAGPDTGVLPPRFRFGLRGAELVTLTMAGRVAIRNGRIEVRDPAPLADPALNYALARLAGSGGAELSQWMVDLPPMYCTSYFERLRVAGALTSVRVWLLLIAKRTGYLVVDQAYFHEVRMRLHAAVTSSGPVAAADAALAGLVYAAGLAQLAYPGGANAALRARLEQLAGGNPALAGSAAAAPRAREVPVSDDPNRWFNDQAQGAGVVGIAGIEAAVRSASEAAVHAVISSVSEAVHAATDAGSHSHHGGGSSSGDASPSPSHHHG
jgi:Golgi phosphoprotein 3 (GPP34)